MFNSIISPGSSSSQVFHTSFVRLGEPKKLRYVTVNNDAPKFPEDMVLPNCVLRAISIEERGPLIAITHIYRQHSESEIGSSDFSQRTPNSNLCSDGGALKPLPHEDDGTALKEQIKDSVRKTAEIRAKVGEEIVPNEREVVAELFSSKLIVAHGLTHVMVYPLLEKNASCSIS